MRTKPPSNSHLRSKRSRILEFVESRNLGFLTNAVAKITSTKFNSYSPYGEDAIVNGLLSKYSFVHKKPLDVSYLDVDLSHEKANVAPRIL